MSPLVPPLEERSHLISPFDNKRLLRRGLMLSYKADHTFDATPAGGDSVHSPWQTPRMKNGHTFIYH
jgi:hypothetical protein